MTPQEDSELKVLVSKLYRLNLYGRWLFVAGSWLILGSLGIWGLREEFGLWSEYFTWTAVRYSFQFQRLSTLSLAFCVGVTAAVLVWQSNNILHGGLAPAEKRRLYRQAQIILATGPKHPLWKWLFPRGKQPNQ